MKGGDEEMRRRGGEEGRRREGDEEWTIRQKVGRRR